MRVTKESQGGQAAALSKEDLVRINLLSRRELTEEEVYTFSVRLCDNEVDRDLERFAPQTLEELAGLFVGKSGLFDHQWSARGQAARIYKTEVVREARRVTRVGDVYCWLKGFAYMLRTDSNRDLIAEIEGGIKKEVSVGCAVERAVCSICGGDLRQRDCGHEKGKVYDGRLCYASLEGASDAYEFSFVAVPAQPAAGVVKGRTDLKALAAAFPGGVQQLEQLEEEARLGRQYLDRLRQEVVRLGLLAGAGLDRETLKSVTGKLSGPELAAMREAYSRQAGSRYPLKMQLEYGEKTLVRQEQDQAFLI
ncbi:MAG: hypothetical protein HFF50_00145 [Lawsonibacter sp.]|nr:hypothetical protein [Lawsonibacter sp.]